MSEPVEPRLPEPDPTPPANLPQLMRVTGTPSKIPALFLPVLGGAAFVVGLVLAFMTPGLFVVLLLLAVPTFLRVLFSDQWKKSPDKRLGTGAILSLVFSSFAISILVSIASLAAGFVVCSAVFALSPKPDDYIGFYFPGHAFLIGIIAALATVFFFVYILSKAKKG